MRIYKSDGSFVEDTNDTEFGWYLSDIVIDESAPYFKERNKETRTMSKLCKSLNKNSFIPSMDSIDVEDIAESSVGEIIPEIPEVGVYAVTNIDEAEIGINLEEFTNIELEREKLISNINPCSVESKMLLAVIYYSKYKSLVKREAAESLVSTVNFKTTNFRCLLSDNKMDLGQDVFEEILNYHNTKEDNMLSLMMDLILTDTDCSVQDLMSRRNSVVTNNILSRQNSVISNIPQVIFETSDLGNSIPSSSSSKCERSDKDYLHVSDRSNILSSIGLSDEDKSIQNFCEETFEMHHELAEIKKSFEELESRVNKLIRTAMALQNDLKEELYLNDIIHLLRGDIEKVKYKRLPFRIFHQGEREPNLII